MDCLSTVAALIDSGSLAYVGPGPGVSLLAAILGLLATVGVALASVILWPLRRMRRRKAAKLRAEEAQRQAASVDGPPAS